MKQNSGVAADCPCPKADCERHGKCFECVQFHRDKPVIVCCMRDEYRKKDSK